MGLQAQKQFKNPAVNTKDKQKGERYRPIVSIIVPTYNEEDDIRRTLEALVKLRYPHKEVIVVDDSTDRTPEIVREYAGQGIRLVKRESGERGRCSARNLGIMEAKGEIVVILNADVFPEPDFLDRILSHYEQGADYILVGSKVANQEYLFPRYLEAFSRFNYDGLESMLWTEGFSCRRQAALDVGLFPVTRIPLEAGEDGYFSEQLLKKGYKKVNDWSIVVPHVIPHTFGEFWRQQEGRGRGAPLIQYYVYKRSLLFLAAKLVAKFFYWPLRSLIEFPWFFAYYCYRSRQSFNRVWRDFFPFAYAKLVELAAHRVGEWKGWWKIFRKEAM